MRLDDHTEPARNGHCRAVLKRLAVAAVALSMTVAAPAAHLVSVVAGIDSAPIVADGTTTGRVTDFVIDLAIDMDPAVPGRTLRAGRTIRVTLPEAFERDPAVPFGTLFNNPACAPSNVQCNTAVLLQGWPQHPVGFPPPNMPTL